MADNHNNSKISEHIKDKSKIDESIFKSNIMDENYSDFEDSKHIDEE